jgi:Tol biopolymer transport system component
LILIFFHRNENKRLSIPENLKDPKQRLLTKSNANPTLLWWVCHEGERDYGMVAISFGQSNTLFQFKLINSKHKLLKFEIVMNKFFN